MAEKKAYGLVWSVKIGTFIAYEGLEIEYSFLESKLFDIYSNFNIFIYLLTQYSISNLSKEIICVERYMERMFTIDIFESYLNKLVD